MICTWMLLWIGFEYQSTLGLIFVSFFLVDNLAPLVLNHEYKTFSPILLTHISLTKISQTSTLISVGQGSIITTQGDTTNHMATDRESYREGIKQLKTIIQSIISLNAQCLAQISHRKQILNKYFEFVCEWLNADMISH